MTIKIFCFIVVLCVLQELIEAVPSSRDEDDKGETPHPVKDDHLETKNSAKYSLVIGLLVFVTSTLLLICVLKIVCMIRENGLGDILRRNSAGNTMTATRRPNATLYGPRIPHAATRSNFRREVFVLSTNELGGKFEAPPPYNAVVVDRLATETFWEIQLDDEEPPTYDPKTMGRT